MTSARLGFAKQRGGFAVGLVVGLLLGLVLALGVALYVTKVPVPFVNKVPQRTAEQDAAEIEKNKNWDPNAPLYGKNPVKPPSAASAAEAAAVAAAKAASAASARDPAAILAGKPVAKASAPAGGASQVASTKPVPDPFSYFVQAGAYADQEEAEQQRARLAIIGFEAKLTEREQAGRTMYRVRVGPYEKKDDADAAKEKLNEAGVESALVRVQR
jgi:cell division protein FtsN